MKRLAPDLRGISFLIVLLLILASVAWSAPARTRTVAKRPARAAAAVRKPVAQAPAKPVAAVAAKPRTAAPGEAGMRIFRDAETGEVGPPTPENVRELAL